LGALHELTYLIYWYGAEDESSYYGYAVPNKFVPYDVERNKSKSVHQMPAHIQTKLAMGIVKKTEMAMVRQYHEMEEDLLLEPNQRRRGMIPFDEWNKQVSGTSQESHMDDIVAIDTESRKDAKMAASPASKKGLRAVKTETVPMANDSVQSSTTAIPLGLAALPVDDTARDGSSSAADTSTLVGTSALSVTEALPARRGARQSDAVNGAQEGDTVFQLYLNCYLGLKDQQKALLNECEALVDRKRELDGKLANLSIEVHNVDESIEIVEPEHDNALDETLALLTMDASAKEDHGHCPDQMKALLDRASEQVKEASKLKIQLGKQVEQQQLALASQSQEFHAWKARLARIDALREQHLASLPEIFRKARSGE
jgi:hypothetical protein